MRDGVPSLTAQRVAAVRAGFARLPADFGDPAAEDRLAADLAAEQAAGPAAPASPAGGAATAADERLGRYLEGRTQFFDRVVVRAIDRGARQIVIVGAGYDGRAWRYAKEGVRFFEVDHPATQADKRERVGRLGLDVAHLAFVAFDLRSPGLAEALLHAGVSPDAPAAILCEGLLAYLEPPAIPILFDELRVLATPGTRLALSASRPGARGTEQSTRLRERVAAAGEPVANVLEPGALAVLLAERRWRSVEISARATAAGFVVAAPVWAPARDAGGATAGRIGRYLDATLGRRGEATLAEHLASAHGLPGPSLEERDVGVHAVRCADERRFIARVFPVARPHAAVVAEAELLHRLHEAGFPAERPAERPGGPPAVSTHAGQAVLLTEYVGGHPLGASPRGLERLGEMLGRLHALAAGWDGPPGGAWHHLVPAGGRPEDEIAAARELLEAARPRVPEAGAARLAALVALLAQADGCAGLPEALTHPDFVPANAIVPVRSPGSDPAAPGEGPVLVDWSGAGRAPRLWSLGFLLWAAAHEREERAAPVMEGYRRHVALGADERDRLAGAILARPAVLGAWMFVAGRRPLAVVAADLADLPERAARIASLARAAV